MKGRREEAVVIAVNDRGVHLLNAVTLVSGSWTFDTYLKLVEISELFHEISNTFHQKYLFFTQDPLHSYTYSMILCFGGYHDDFMLTVNRPHAAADEPNRERITFA
jgi:hypothetical protein